LALFVYHGENLQRLPMLPVMTIAITLGLLSAVDAITHGQNEIRRK